jgi:aspartate-semialdehyde dehydrogenase
MKKVGFVGWRGMVGSVLLDRMKEEEDFNNINAYFFSTSQAGMSAPEIRNGEKILLDAHSIKNLLEMDIILS